MTAPPSSAATPPPAASPPPSDFAATPSLWYNRAFLTLWAGQSVSVFGTQITTFALPWLVLDLTHTAAAVGVLNAVSFLPYLIFSLPAGMIADRWNRRTIMLVCDVARGLIILSVPIAAALGQLTLVQIFVVGALMRLFTVFFDVGYVAALPNLVEKPQLPDANGRIELTRSTAEFSGQPLGGVLVALLTAAGTLALDSLSYVVSVVSLLFIRAPFSAPRLVREEGSFRQRLMAGMQYVFSDPLLRALALAPALGNLATSAFLAVVVFRARDELHFTAFETGLFVGSVAIGQAIAATFVGRLTKRVPTGQLILRAVMFQPFVFLLFTLTGNLIVMIALHLTLGAMVTLLNVPMNSLRQSIIPDHVRGRVLAAIRMLVLSMAPVGAIIGGVIATGFGARATFAFTAAVIAGAAIFVARSAIPQASLPAR